MKKISYLILGMIMFIFPFIANAKEINAYLFYQETCIHCKGEIKFFEEYTMENSDVKLIKYEISKNKNNRELFNTAKMVMKKDINNVPYLIIGSSVIVGYDESYTKNNILDKIDYYRNNDYEDIWGNHLLGIESEVIEVKDSHVTLPVLGKINVKEVSLVITAVVLGFIDGFNPCAMWILIFLITMLLNVSDKKKRWILGTIFLAASGLIYLLFMVSWLSLASVVNNIKTIRMLIGLFAVIFGFYNIYNSANKKEVGCEVVDDRKRKSIIKRIKNITIESKLVLSIVGIVLLAVSVNFIELMCSLGLPVLFTQILSMNDLSVYEYGLDILIYIIFYLIDDIIIFVIAMKTLEIKAISNKFGKYSHLIGGIVMLIIGVLVMFKPEWLMFNL